MAAEAPRSPLMPTCPSCGGATDEAPPGRDSCPRCRGSLPAPADDFIASWKDPADSPELRRAEDVECRACGYSGAMNTVQDHLICPACGASDPRRRVEDAPVPARVADAPVEPEVIECPNCGRAIEVQDVEAGKSVLCTSCSAFLGCMKKRANRAWWFRGLRKGI